MYEPSGLELKYILLGGAKLPTSKQVESSLKEPRNSLSIIRRLGFSVQRSRFRALRFRACSKDFTGSSTSLLGKNGALSPQVQPLVIGPLS